MHAIDRDHDANEILPDGPEGQAEVGRDLGDGQRGLAELQDRGLLEARGVERSLALRRADLSGGVDRYGNEY